MTVELSTPGHDAIMGRAIVKSCFGLGQRGWVLVLEPGLLGVIPRDRTLVVNGNLYPYRGPEYVDGADGAFFGVIVNDSRIPEQLLVGCEVSFQ